MAEERSEIRVLDKKTVDQIAAGEVVERPSSVVKELVENAIDAHASAITVEIKNGGIDLIRVTDNGSGIERSQLKTAFLPHATSKIRDAKDLFSFSSLGFRGEALPSVAAVSRVEVITKSPGEVMGASFQINGGEAGEITDIGCPDGTTFLVKDLFYNTPVRRKFLKSPMTEGSNIADLLEKIALSHPEVSVRFINNGSTRLSTSGSGRVRDLIYSVFGRDTAREVTELHFSDDGTVIEGFLGKPVLAKGNRGFENYFINGRYVRSDVISRALEEAYQPFMMQHRYPFAVLYITIPPEDVDVNVHPNKMELRFREEGRIYDLVKRAVREGLSGKEFVPDALNEEKPEEKKLFRAPEPFEQERIREDLLNAAYRADGTLSNRPEKKADIPEQTVKEKPDEPYNRKKESTEEVRETSLSESGYSTGKPVKDSSVSEKNTDNEQYETVPYKRQEKKPETAEGAEQDQEKQITAKEPEKKYETQIPAEETEVTPERTDGEVPEDLFAAKLLSDEGMKKYRLIGQVFDTYWLIAVDDRLYILDQHAAHEKVLYERKMKDLKARKMTSQVLSPPVMVTLTSKEEMLLNRFMNAFSDLGYEISSFGGKEYAISAVPADLYGLNVRDLFTEILGDMEDGLSLRDSEMILSKLASSSCKAAVKGNHVLSFEEADALIRELFTLENPYACPHGRPTMISMTKKELEKKFKRIV